MADYSTTITGTVDADKKTLTITQRLGVYEVRAITLSMSAVTFATGTYKLQITFGANAVALCALTVSTGTLTGTLNLATTQLEAIFAILAGVDRIPCKLAVWDTANNVLYARGQVYIYRNEYSGTATSPLLNKVYHGKSDITNGASSVTVALSDYAPLSSASIAGSVIVPTGLDNIFVVGVTISGTDAIFTLSAPVSGDDYDLNWMVAL